MVFQVFLFIIITNSFKSFIGYSLLLMQLSTRISLHPIASFHLCRLSEKEHMAAKEIELRGGFVPLVRRQALLQSRQRHSLEFPWQ